MKQHFWHTDCALNKIPLALHMNNWHILLHGELINGSRVTLQHKLLLLEGMGKERYDKKIAQRLKLLDFQLLD